jgi:hypothetical protein
MAIPFLNNINLSDNQLLNAKLQVTGTVPTAAAGQIYFNSTDNVARYHNGTAWVDIPRQISVGGTSLADSQAIDLVAGANVGIAESSGTITISSSDQFQGTVTSVSSSTAGDALDVAVTNATTTPDLAFTWAGAVTDYVNGEGNLVTFPTIPGAYTWTVSDGSNSTPVASGETVTFSGTANEIEVLEGSRTVTIGLPNDVTIANNLTVGGTGNFTGQVTIPILPVASTDAASKDYVDNAVVGGLVYQGGYNAATNTPDLTTSPNSILKGWTYTVTADGTFFGEQLRVGDVLIAEVNDPSALTDWTTVQNNIDLASLTQVGIGNVNIDGAGNKDGLSLAYASGTATVGLDINGLPSFSINPISGADLLSLEIPLYNGDSSDANEKIEVATLLSAASSQISYAETITDTDLTIDHNLGTKDVIVQLFDVFTGETVYADVERISTSRIGVTFSATPTNSIRVLVQKIG